MATEARPVTGVWAFDPTHSTAEFSVKHMVITTVRGHFSQVEATVDFNEAQPEKSRVEARIGIASVSTKDAQRDAHLRSADFFDAEKYPWMTFASKRIERRGGRYAMIGDLTIKGVTREVVFDAEFGGTGKDPWGGQRAGFSAQTAINRKDFGLTWNVALETGGVLVGEQVKINLEVELVKQAQQAK